MKGKKTAWTLFPQERVTPIEREQEKILIEAARQDRDDGPYMADSFEEWMTLFTALTAQVGLVSVDVKIIHCDGPSTEIAKAMDRLPIHLRGLAAICLRWLEAQDG